MPSGLITLMSSKTVTTTTTVAGHEAGQHSARYGNYYLQIDSVGSGSGWTVNLNWLDPNARASFAVGTAQSLTATGSSGFFTLNTLLTNTTAVAYPLANQIVFKPVTAGTTTSLAATVYFIPGV